MKFAFAAVVLFCLITASLSLVSCKSEASPAKQLFSEFKAHVAEGDLDAAYSMLETSTAPERSQFNAGMSGAWGKWFGEDSTLQQIQLIQGDTDRIGGDIILMSDKDDSGDSVESGKSVGGFEVTRTSGETWKIVWKLGKSAPSEEANALAGLD